MTIWDALLLAIYLATVGAWFLDRGHVKKTITNHSINIQVCQAWLAECAKLLTRLGDAMEERAEIDKSASRLDNDKKETH